MSERWVLRVTSGEQSGEEWELSSGQEAVLGCAEDADFRLSEDGVAFRHLRLSCEGATLLIEDIGSKTGFVVNGDKLRHATLHRTTQITVGRAHLRARLSAMETTTSTAMAERAAEPTTPGVREPPPLALQHIWYELRRGDYWRTLAILPTVNNKGALRVAHAFAEMASLDPEARVLVINATPGSVDPARNREDLLRSIPLYPHSSYDYLDATAAGVHQDQRAIPRLLTFIENGGARHDTILVALGSLLENPRTIPLARVADVALLGIECNKSKIKDTRRIIDLVERQRVIGSIVLN